MPIIAYRSCPDGPLSAGLQPISVHRIGPRRLVPGGAVRGEVVDLAHDRGEGVAGGQFVLAAQRHLAALRSEEHTSELQSLMRSSYAVFCLKKQQTHTDTNSHKTQ